MRILALTAESVPRCFISGWSDNMAGENPANYFSSDGDAWDIGLNADGDVVLGSLCTIITQPADKSVIEGKTATFTVNATGSEPLSYQWQQSIDNGNNWTNIASANAAEYTTGKTTMDMSGNQYRCVVTGVGGAVISDPRPSQSRTPTNRPAIGRATRTDTGTSARPAPTGLTTPGICAPSRTKRRPPAPMRATPATRSAPSAAT